MRGELQIAILNIIICSFFGFYLGPLIRNLGFKYNILDIPNFRKVHKKPIVRIGGLSILIPFFVWFFVTKENFNFEYLSSVEISSYKIILIGSFLFFLVGIHDDIFKSPPLFRLFVQFLIAFVVSFAGINFPDFYFYLAYFGEINILLSPFLSSIFSGIWIVSITN